MAGVREESAVEYGSEVAKQHRKVLRKLRETVQILTEEVEAAVVGASPGSTQISAAGRGSGVTSACGLRGFADKDSAADALAKIIGILSKLVPLEREAFQLNSKIDIQDLSDEQVLRLLEKLPAA